MDADGHTPGKRKRDMDVPRITYHVGSRTFDRLFREETLNETKDVVRRKLCLPEGTDIHLAQLRGEHAVDLEDEDDFDAFYAVAQSKMAVEVQVTIQGAFGRAMSVPPLPDDSNGHGSLPPDAHDDEPVDSTLLRKRKVTFVANSATDPQNVPPKKRRMSISSSSRPTLPSVTIPRPLSLTNASTSTSPTSSDPSSTTFVNEGEPSDIPVQTHIATEAPKSSVQSGEKPSKPKKKTKVTANEGPEIESTSGSTSPLHPPPAEDSSTNVNGTEDSTKKRRKKKRKGVLDATPSATSSHAAEVPEARAVTEPKSKKDKAVIAFTEELAEMINKSGSESSQRGKTVPPDDSAPLAKRQKRRNSVAGAPSDRPNGKSDNSAEATDGALRTCESLTHISNIGKTKGKRKRKESQPPTASREDLIKFIRQVSKFKQDDSHTTSDDVPPNKEAAAPSSSTHSSRLAKTSTTRTNGVADRTEAKMKKTDPKPRLIAQNIDTSRSSASTSTIEGENRSIVTKPGNAYADIDLDSLLRGPRKRRLTVDHVLPAALLRSPKVVLEEDKAVKEKPSRRSLAAKVAWSDSDSDDDGEESDKDGGSRETPRHAAVPVVNRATITTASVRPAPQRAEVENQTPAVDRSVPSDSPTQVSPVGAAITNAVIEFAAASSDPVITAPADTQSTSVPSTATPFPSGTTPSDIVPIQSAEKPIVVVNPDAAPISTTEDHDPIEPVIPSPRSRSPIETAVPTANSPSPGVREKNKPKTPLQPTFHLPSTRRLARNINSQPVSKHEANVRESAGRVTRSQSKQSLHSLNVPTPSVTHRSPEPPSPRRLRSSSQHSSKAPNSVASSSQHSSKALDSAVALSSQAKSPAGAGTWTVLDGPASTIDADSSPGLVDELRSSPEPDKSFGEYVSEQDEDNPARDNPLFLASESQVGFPYSQFQDIDVDTDDPETGDVPPVTRLEQESDDDEEEVQDTVVPEPRPSKTYRSLSQLVARVGQNTFFPKFLSQAPATSTPKQTKEDMYGTSSQAFEDEGSDSASESEAETSHIPKARRAGNKRSL